MVHELRLFLTALMFYTRIPCPAWVGHDTEQLERSRKYFPLVGWVIGGMGVSVLWGCHYLLPISVALLLAVAFTIYWTGGFHEDGLSDSFDALGGAWSKEEVLRIMKDSRVGTFGILALILSLLLKLFVLLELARASIFLAMIVWFNGQVISRFLATLFIRTHAYVQDPDQSRSKPMAKGRLSNGEFLYSTLWAALPLLLFYEHPIFLFALLPAFLAKLYMAFVFQKRIGGFTGDALGAVQQISEGVFLLSALVLWNFIS